MNTPRLCFFYSLYAKTLSDKQLDVKLALFYVRLARMKSNWTTADDSPF